MIGWLSKDLYPVSIYVYTVQTLHVHKKNPIKHTGFFGPLEANEERQKLQVSDLAQFVGYSGHDQRILAPYWLGVLNICEAFVVRYHILCYSQ